MKDVCKTLRSDDKMGVIVNFGSYVPSSTCGGKIVKADGIAPTVMENLGNVTAVAEPQIIGYTRSNDGKGIGYHTKDVANTLHGSTGSGGNTDQFVSEPQIIQLFQLYPDSGNPQAGRVYDSEGVSPSIDTCQGGNRMPKILTPIRTEEQRELRKRGIDTFTGRQLLPREDDCCNTITTVQKDNLLQEPCILQRPHGYFDGGVTDTAPTVKSSAYADNNYLQEPVNRHDSIAYKTMPNGNIRAYNASTYDKSGISEMQITHPDNESPTITTAQCPKILEPVSCAVRGRGENNEQRLEIGDNSANCVTSVQKDSMVMEPGKTDSYEYRMMPNGNIRAYNPGSKNYEKGVNGYHVTNPENISETVIAAHAPKVYEKSKAEIEITDPSVWVDPETNKAYYYKDGCLWRIRKLMPSECLRLMDVSEEDIEKICNCGVSKTGIYSLAGNSIVTQVLTCIFKKLFIDKSNPDQQLTLF